MSWIAATGERVCLRCYSPRPATLPAVVAAAGARGQFGQGSQDGLALLGSGYYEACRVRQVFSMRPRIAAQQTERVLDGDVEAVAHETGCLVDDHAVGQCRP